MKRDVAEAALAALVRDVQPQGAQGHSALQEACAALAALPKGIPSELVRRACARLLAVAPARLWPLCARARPEHAQAFLDAVVGHPLLPARFLVAAASGGTSSRVLDEAGALRFIAAGALLARVVEAPAPATRAPFDRASAAVTPALGPLEPMLPDALERALQARLPHLQQDESALATWLLWWLASLGGEPAKRTWLVALKLARQGQLAGIEAAPLRKQLGLFVGQHPALAQVLLSS
jgi:hypothetical protein